VPGCSEGNEDNQSAQNFRSRILNVRIRQLLRSKVGNVRAAIAAFSKYFREAFSFDGGGICRVDNNCKTRGDEFLAPGVRGSRISLQVTRQLPIAITEPHGIGLGRSAKK